MTQNERLLRIAGITIILRDELEECGRFPEWVQTANDYLNTLTQGHPEVTEEFNKLFWHIDNVIREVDKPCNLVDELILILKTDLKKCKIEHQLKHATDLLPIWASVKLVKLLDSKIRLV